MAHLTPWCTGRRLNEKKKSSYSAVCELSDTISSSFSLFNLGTLYSVLGNIFICLHIHGILYSLCVSEGVHCSAYMI